MTEQPMTFPRRDRGRTRRVGTHAEYDNAKRLWVSTPIRIFTRKAFRP